MIFLAYDIEMKSENNTLYTCKDFIPLIFTSSTLNLMLQGRLH